MSEHLNKFTDELHFLNDSCLRLSQLEVLNDPYEALPKLLLNSYSEDDWRRGRKRAAQPGEMTDEEIEDFVLHPFPSMRFDEERFPGLWPVTERRLQDEPFETQAELDTALARRAVERIVAQAYQTIGIISFSSTENEVLWSHYADAHKGIMISFNPNHGFFSGKLRPVLYSDTGVSVSSNGGTLRLAGEKLNPSEILDGTRLPIPLELFLRKTTSWSYEGEVRIIQPLQSADDCSQARDGRPLYKLRFPAEAVQSITFGYLREPHTVDSDVRRLRRTPLWQGVRIYKRRWTASGVVIDSI